MTALDRVNLSIAEHEFVAVWGPSGSGKSTFCNVIGLLDSPTSGDVYIREQPVAKLSDAKRSEIRNNYIGFVFQNFNLVPVLSALENVMLPLQIQGVSKKEAQKKATLLLEEVELSDRMGHRPQKLSGGQQQRVAIARALVTDPLLVIADEPTANLDTRSANLIVNLMRKINETRGAAFVFSTHDDRLLDRVDRKIHLQDGAVLEDTGATSQTAPADNPPEPEPKKTEAIYHSLSASAAPAAVAATPSVSIEPPIVEQPVVETPVIEKPITANPPSEAQVAAPEPAIKPPAAPAPAPAVEPPVENIVFNSTENKAAPLPPPPAAPAEAPQPEVELPPIPTPTINTKGEPPLAD